jgi:hypothetical protein
MYLSAIPSDIAVDIWFVFAKVRRNNETTKGNDEKVGEGTK